mmetsp:Transcript_42217/g.108722  ORF Transcript_42217/g.108722 Transcript_42217/m.108722 type:complete len:493 (-) Transcript_42217:157-1635(-)
MGGGSEEEGVTYERKEVSWQRRDDRFKQKEKVARQQYASLYFFRLQKLRLKLFQRAKKLWAGSEGLGADKESFSRILDLTAGGKNVICGTLYKSMKLKPTVMSEYLKDFSMEDELKKEHYTSEDDTLELEDESGRVELICDDNKKELVASLVSGLVCALKGESTEKGDFIVEDVLFPGPDVERLGGQESETSTIPPSLTDSDPSSPAPTENSNKVAFISDLGFGDGSVNPLIYDLLLEYMTGCLGDATMQKGVSGISRIIICGNSLSLPNLPDPIAAGAVKSSQRLRESSELKKVEIRNTTDVVKECDSFLSQLCSSCPVDLMPGEEDPTTYMLPQKPIHTAMLPESSSCYHKEKKTPMLSAVCNPYEVNIDNRTFLGTSGQPLSNLKKYCDVKDDCEALIDFLRWSHLAPSAPDTLPCYPFVDKDPFIIDSIPDVFFSATEQASHCSTMTRNIDGVEKPCLCLGVPSFKKTSSFVLVDTSSMTVETVTFEC